MTPAASRRCCWPAAPERSQLRARRGVQKSEQSRPAASLQSPSPRMSPPPGRGSALRRERIHVVNARRTLLLSLLALVCAALVAPATGSAYVVGIADQNPALF